MTDRSSEERSRFEKTMKEARGRLRLAALPMTRLFENVYADKLIQAAWEGWMARAALEDRQEAAPVKDANNTTAEELEAWNKYGHEWWRNGYNSGLERGGVPSEATNSKPDPTCPNCGWYAITDCERCGWWVDAPQESANPLPSEATPTKENAPPANDACAYVSNETGRKCGVFRGNHNSMLEHGNSHDWMPAPAPEVQGTPKITLGPNTIEVSHYPQGNPTFIPAPPVGTPQKETRPKFTNRHGKPCSQACYEGRHAECTEDFVTCNCTFRGEHKTPHAYATVVPEGVQGKEPQTFETFEEFWDAHEDFYAEDNEARATFEAGKRSGEATGRRSAITELQEWILCQGWTGSTIGVSAAILAKCAELQEKTK